MESLGVRLVCVFVCIRVGVWVCGCVGVWVCYHYMKMAWGLLNLTTALSLLACRLERNQEREQGVSNMEYLKNVVLKVWNNILGTRSCLELHPSTPVSVPYPVPAHCRSRAGQSAPGNHPATQTEPTGGQVSTRNYKR